MSMGRSLLDRDECHLSLHYVRGCGMVIWRDQKSVDSLFEEKRSYSISWPALPARLWCPFQEQIGGSLSCVLLTVSTISTTISQPILTSLAVSIFKYSKLAIEALSLHSNRFMVPRVNSVRAGRIRSRAEIASFNLLPNSTTPQATH